MQMMKARMMRAALCIGLAQLFLAAIVNANAVVLDERAQQTVKVAEHSDTYLRGVLSGVLHNIKIGMELEPDTKNHSNFQRRAFETRVGRSPVEENKVCLSEHEEKNIINDIMQRIKGSGETFDSSLEFVKQAKIYLKMLYPCS